MGKSYGGLRERLFMKSDVVLNLNYLDMGRVSDYKYISESFMGQCTIRPGFLAKNRTIIQYPIAYERNITTSQFPEGLKIILPYEANSVGYNLFCKYPIVKMAQLEQKIQEMRIYIANQIEANSMITPSQIYQTMRDILDITKQTRESISLPEETMIIPRTPTRPQEEPKR